MLADDGHPYVVKFKNNPQHTRVLANEFLVSRLARKAGLTVPEVAVIDVSQTLIDSTTDLMMDLGPKCSQKCDSGLQFASSFAGGLMPGLTADYLPEEELLTVTNLAEFAGILALDKWTGNADGRQAVFARKARDRRYRANFIDFGYCFHAGDWKFDDVPLRGVYYRNDVYSRVSGWDSFEPWLSRIESMPIEEMWSVAAEIPPEWYGDQAYELEMLIEKLFSRRSGVRELIRSFGESDRNPFPRWMSLCDALGQGESAKLLSGVPEEVIARDRDHQKPEVLSEVSTTNALREFAFQLIRYVPNPVRSEFVNIGILLRAGGSSGLGSMREGELRITSDWRRVRGLDPDADTASLAAIGAELQSAIRDDSGGQAARILDSLSLNVQLTEPKAFLAESLSSGIEELMRLYVD